MRGFHYLLEAFSAHDVNHPHRVHLSEVICKLMAYDTPDQDDIAVIIQAFAMQPILCTLDLQDTIDVINAVHGTSFTIQG